MGHTSSAEKMKELLDRYFPPRPEDENCILIPDLSYAQRWEGATPARRVLEPGAYVVQDGYPPKDRYPDNAKVGGHRGDIEVPRRGVYTGLDILPGTNVDVVAEDPLHWPLEDGSYDLVLSAQCMEHVDDLAAFTAECYRVLVPGGLCIHLVPTAGPYHAFPMDCWRVMKDGMAWLLRGAGFEVLESEQHDAHPWNDCWGVGKKPA